MSFLHDPNIWSKILREAQVVPNGAGGAGGAPTGSVAPIQTNQDELAKKLVNRLSRQLADQPEPLNISSGTPESDLMVNNLKDLSELLKYAHNNQLKVDGIRVVYDGAEAKNLPKSDLAKLAKITVDVSRNPDVPGQSETRKWNTADYWADMPTLIKYVGYLQQKAKTMQENKNESGKVLEVMVGKIIDQINAYKPDSGLTRKPKSQPGKPNDMPDGTFIDGLDPKIFDLSAPIVVNRTTANPLRSENLKTKTDLDAWLADAKVISTDSKGVNKVDQCVVVNVLYKRAKYLESIAANDTEAKAAAYYVKKIQEFGPMFTGIDGKACSVGGVVAGTGAGTGTGSNGKGTSGTGGNSSVSIDSIKKSISLLPLKVENIDFNRIQSFCRQYEIITAHPGTKAAINQADDLIANIKSMLKNKEQTVFTLGADANTVKNWIGLDPPGRYYAALLDKLTELITLTTEVITDLKGAYVDSIGPDDTAGLDPNYKAYVYGQVGRTPEDNSFSRRNLNQLALLKSQVNAVNTVGKLK